MDLYIENVCISKIYILKFFFLIENDTNKWKDTLTDWENWCNREGLNLTPLNLFLTLEESLLL